jgi:hypothetical protein
VPTNIARALIEGLKHDFSADDAELRRLVPQRLLAFANPSPRSSRPSAPVPVVARWIEGAFAVRKQRIDYAYYAKRASASHETTASPAAVWSVLREIGGERGWFYMNGLWQLRETLDWVAGGPGRRHGRRIRRSCASATASTPGRCSASSPSGA